MARILCIALIVLVSAGCGYDYETVEVEVTGWVQFDVIEREEQTSKVVYRIRVFGYPTPDDLATESTRLRELEPTRFNSVFVFFYASGIESEDSAPFANAHHVRDMAMKVDVQNWPPQFDDSVKYGMTVAERKVLYLELKRQDSRIKNVDELKQTRLDLLKSRGFAVWTVEQSDRAYGDICDEAAAKGWPAPLVDQ